MGLTALLLLAASIVLALGVSIWRALHVMSDPPVRYRLKRTVPPGALGRMQRSGAARYRF